MPEKGKFKHRFRWEMINLGRTFRQRLGGPLDADLQPLLEGLRRDGIVTCDVRWLLGAEAHLFDRLREKTLALWKSDAIRDKAAKLNGEKKFKVMLLDRNVAGDDPMMQLSLNPRVLSVVNAYMGMRSYLRALDLWWDRPTPEGPAATQLWHRDLDDARCIKAFIYFNDVDMQTGPFSYLRGTHMFGRHANLQPGGSNDNRFSDEQIVAPLSMADAQINTGPAGTLILCDTYGFHRGVKPQKDRLMSLFQYVSGASKYAREFRVLGQRPALNPAQEQALDPLPADAAKN